jgi:putative ABC transport system permease protein
LDNIYTQTMVWKSIIYALRLFQRDRLHFMVTLLGLTIGFSCGIVILLFARNELSYEAYHEKADRIYRVSQNFVTSGKPKKFAWTSPALGPKLYQEYAQIETFTRLKYVGRVLFRCGNESYYENHIAFADTNFFKVFTHRFIYGDPATCLARPENIVLTEDLYHKYFGNDDPVGRTILLENEYPLTVSAVIENLPPNTHFYQRAYISYLGYDDHSPLRSTDWSLFEVEDHTFLMFYQDFDRESFDRQWPAFYKKYLEADGRDYGQVYEPIFQKIRDIHYHSDLPTDYQLGNKTYFYTIVSLGIFLLVLAGINYTNMATAMFVQRLKVVSIHKVLGAGTGSLVLKLLSESMVMTLIALLLSFGIVEYLMEFTGFTDLLGLRHGQHMINNGPVLMGGFVMAITVGILSGIYPAGFYTRFSLVRGLYGGPRSGRYPKLQTRQFLVVFQLILAVVAVTFTVLMKSQITYLENKDPGFNRDNVLLMSCRDSVTRASLPFIQEELLKMPQVQSVTSARSYPGNPAGGLYRFEGDSGMEEHNLPVLFVDYDFLQTLGLSLAKGRDFSRKHKTDIENAIIINQSLARYMDWEKPIGKAIHQGPRFQSRVIGVVEDFNFRSLHHSIEPLMIRLQREPVYLIVKIVPQGTEKVLSSLENRMKELVPFRPFEYDFLDESFKRQYLRDERQLSLISLFSGLCIFIACLGLFTLISYTAERRTKEIGIRKVNGALTSRVISLFIKQFLLYNLIAIFLSTPIIIWLFKHWLKEFAYQVEIRLTIFILIFTGVMLITVLTVIYHAVKASRSNPVNSLRYE